MIKFDFARVKEYFIENKGVSFLFFIISIFLCFVLDKIFYYPVYIDEAITYNDYVSKGLYGALSSYDQPNNHVFYSLILVLFTKLPIDLLVVMRLFNVLVALVSVFLMYRYLRAKFPTIVALFGVSFFLFSYYFLFYAIFARGYMILIFCTISLFSVLDCMQVKFSKKYFILLGIISLVGFSTVPIFLYVFLSFLILIFFRLLTKEYSRSLVVPFIITFIITFFAVILFYTPIFMKDGIGSITNNEWTVILTFDDVCNYISSSWKGFYDKIFGIQSIWIMIALIFFGGIVFYYDRKSRFCLLENFIFIFLPFIFILFHKVIPGARTWSYLIVPFTFVLAYFFNYFYSLTNKSISIRWLSLFVCVVLIFFQSLIFNKTHRYSGHINDYYYGRFVNILDVNDYKVKFLNGNRSYESVLYKFEKIRKANNLQEVTTNSLKNEVYVGSFKLSVGVNNKTLLLVDRKIDLCAYQLKR